MRGCVPDVTLRWPHCRNTCSGVGLLCVCGWLYVCVCEGEGEREREREGCEACICTCVKSCGTAIWLASREQGHLASTGAQ